MKTKTDPTIAGCLARIQRGDVSAAGVLADYLEENNLPNAKKVRALWVKVQGWYQVVVNRDPAKQARRRHTKWERIAIHRRYLRNEIANVYGRTWKALPLTAFK